MMTVGRWDRATIRYVNAMDVRPSDEQIDIINNFIVGLKDSGIWKNSIWCSLLAGDTQQATLLNAKNPVEALTAVNSPTFIQNEGWQGNRVNSYLSGPNWRDVAGVDGFIYGAITAGTEAAANYPLLGSDSGTVIFILRPRISGNNVLARYNSTTTVNGASSTIIGNYLAVGNNNVVTTYKNGSLLSSGSVSPSVSTPGNMTILRDTTLYSDFKCPIVMTGNEPLDSQQALDLHNLTQNYLTELGTL